jgi:hypothetical protein
VRALRRRTPFAEESVHKDLESLLGCAAVNGLERHGYLLHLLEELPKASTADALKTLLPWNVKPILQAQPS